MSYVHRLSFIFWKLPLALVALFLSVLAGFLIPTVSHAQTASVVGTVASVSSCTNPSGYGVVLQSTSTPLIYQIGVSTSYPQGSVPKAGQEIYATLGAVLSCSGSSGTAISGRLIVFFEPTTLITSGSSSGSSSGSTGSFSFAGLPLSFLSTLVQGLLSAIFSSGLTTAPTNPPPIPAPIPFGGQILAIQACIAPPGAFLITLGPPTPGLYLFIPGRSKPYIYYPPYHPSQWLLGSADPLAACVTAVGAAPIPAKPINAAPGIGASGPTNQNSCLKPNAATNAQCPQSQYNVANGNSACLAQAEAAVRNYLSQCSNGGISVNKSACPVGATYQATTGGCTNISGLQCSTTSYLCNLFAACGPFTITGGNEGGHKTHGTGNAVDISGGTNFSNGFSQCVGKTFTPCGQKSGGLLFCDTNTGTTFWQEPGGTAPHWHVCVGGKGC